MAPARWTSGAKQVAGVSGRRIPPGRTRSGIWAARVTRPSGGAGAPNSLGLVVRLTSSGRFPGASERASSSDVTASSISTIPEASSSSRTALATRELRAPYMMGRPRPCRPPCHAVRWENDAAPVDGSIRTMAAVWRAATGWPAASGPMIRRMKAAWGQARA